MSDRASATGICPALACGRALHEGDRSQRRRRTRNPAPAARAARADARAMRRPMAAARIAMQAAPVMPPTLACGAQPQSAPTPVRDASSAGPACVLVGSAAFRLPRAALPVRQTARFSPRPRACVFNARNACYRRSAWAHGGHKSCKTIHGHEKTCGDMAATNPLAS